MSLVNCKMERPRIEIRLSRIDWTLEVIGGLGLFLTFAYAASCYQDLPEVIPTHFNGSGVADGFGNKLSIWMLPLIMLILYTALTMILRYPHFFNYPTAITTENAVPQYRNAVMMIRVLKTVLVATFSYLTYASVQNGLGKMNGLGTWFLPIFLTAVLGTVGVLVYRAIKLR